MENEGFGHDLQLYQGDNYSIDQIRAAWLDAKFRKSKSEKTRKAYEDTFDSFRVTLQSFGLDLDRDPVQISLVAQGWAARRSPGASREGDVKENTYNQRLATISSFYTYAHKHRMLPGENPIEMVERATVQEYASAEALEAKEVEAVLKKINRKTLVGKRDYALLSIALQTGRRAQEIAGIHYGHLTIKAATNRQGERVTVFFPRLKGGKSASNVLEGGTSAALLDYLQALYGSELGILPHQAPLWISLSRNGTKGQPIGVKALEGICKKRCGSSKFHLLRHTFAVNMEEAGAKVSEIKEKLGHSTGTDTGRYLDHFKSSTNKHGTKLESMYGITTPEESEE